MLPKLVLFLLGAAGEFPLPTQQRPSHALCELAKQDAAVDCPHRAADSYTITPSVSLALSDRSRSALLGTSQRGRLQLNARQVVTGEAQTLKELTNFVSEVCAPPSRPLFHPS